MLAWVASAVRAVATMSVRRRTTGAHSTWQCLSDGRRFSAGSIGELGGGFSVSRLHSSDRTSRKPSEPTPYVLSPRPGGAAKGASPPPAASPPVGDVLDGCRVRSALR